MLDINYVVCSFHLLYPIVVCGYQTPARCDGKSLAQLVAWRQARQECTTKVLLENHARSNRTASASLRGRLPIVEM